MCLFCHCLALCYQSHSSMTMAVVRWSFYSTTAPACAVRSVDFRWAPLNLILVQWSILKWSESDSTLLQSLARELYHADGLVAMLSCYREIVADYYQIVRTCQTDPYHGVMTLAWHLVPLVVLVRGTCHPDCTGLESSLILQARTMPDVVGLSILFCLLH